MPDASPIELKHTSIGCEREKERKRERERDSMRGGEVRKSMSFRRILGHGKVRERAELGRAESSPLPQRLISLTDPPSQLLTHSLFTSRPSSIK